MRIENVITEEGGYIDLFADDLKELWNGKVAGNRVSVPLGSDYSMWIERDIVIEVPPTNLDQFGMLQRII